MTILLRIPENKKMNIGIKLKNFPIWIYWLFYIFTAYMSLPLIDVPLVGLSLSAPIFFFIAFYAIFKSPSRWYRTHRKWITLATLIWMGTFISSTLNGLLSGGININSEGFLSIIRVAYWLLLFVVTIYFAGQLNVITRVAMILGIMSIVLGLMRWMEILVYGNIGAWTGTRWMTQNNYGILFSSFSPFLLVFILKYKGKKRFFSTIALLILWGAVAVNGSRGSWVAIGIGLVIFLFVLLFTHSRKFISIILGLSFFIGVAVLLFTSIPQFSDAVINRFDTFNRLDQDKTYMIRQLMNQKAIKLFYESPVIGIGPSRFRLTSTELEIPLILSYAPQSYFDQKTAHNSYLSYLAETGLIGIFPFVILLILLIFKGFFIVKWFTYHRQYWSLGIYLSFIQMSVHMWVISSLNNSGTWFIYGLVGAMIMLGENMKTNGVSIK